MLKARRLLLTIGISCFLFLPATAGAAGSGSNSGAAPVSSQSVTQGYGTDTLIQNGMIVMLNTKDATKVEPLTTTASGRMLGVIVPSNDSAVTLSNSANHGQVFVATGGRYSVLVSNQNGAIKTGDYVTISALAGIGMKDDTMAKLVLGRAADSFDGTASVGGTAKLKTATGGTATVSIGRIPVDISIGANPQLSNGQKGLPELLQTIGSSIANKQVASGRVYISLLIFIVTTMIACGILYSGIRAGLIAIGRNPLARRSIFGAVFRVILSGILVFTLGLMAVYAILRL